MDEMNISSARYVSIDGENVCVLAVIDGIEFGVPLNQANRHYAAIMQAVENNELTIQEASE